jgi:NAD(P)-dependent dehydrogenase (short-subunit alcohol dehydrogenase family)
VGHDVLRDVGRHSKRTLSSFSTEGKVCVVTGAARGLGNMMARTLVESGATQLVILDLNAEEATKSADELAAWFVAEGEAQPGEIEAVGLGCDVSSEESVKAAFKAVEERFGRVDILVTAAGIVENFPADQYPTDRVRKLLDINVMGTWFCSREAARLMPDGGSQVLIGSMSGSIVNIPQPQTPYNFSSESGGETAGDRLGDDPISGSVANKAGPGLRAAPSSRPSAHLLV